MTVLCVPTNRLFVGSNKACCIEYNLLYNYSIGDGTLYVEAVKIEHLIGAIKGLY